jgi:hypothetical protein
MRTHVLILAAVCTLLLAGCGRKQPIAPAARTYYTEQEVTEFVTPGRSHDEIVGRFGQPGFSTTNGVADVTMFYILPIPDPIVPETFAFSGFQVRLTNGIVASWVASHRDVR